MALTGGKEIGACKMIYGKRLQKVIKGKWSQLANLFSIVALEDSHAEHEGQGEIFLTVNIPQGMPNQVHHLDSFNTLLEEY